MLIVAKRQEKVNKSTNFDYNNLLDFYNNMVNIVKNGYKEYEVVTSDRLQATFKKIFDDKESNIKVYDFKTVDKEYNKKLFSCSVMFFSNKDIFVMYDGDSLKPDLFIKGFYDCMAFNVIGVKEL